MRTHNLGHSQIAVSAISVGCNAFGTRIGADEATSVIHAALDEGITFFDTADSYGFGASEELLGQALGNRRSEVVIATKFGLDMQGKLGDDLGRRGRPEYVRAAVDASLRRLGTDVIDLYQFHSPDLNTPIEETLGALNELVEAGKVRAIGCSNFQAWELVDAAWQSRTHQWAEFATAQNEYSMYNRTAETELVPACLEFGVGILPYFPLAYGLLSGKYTKAEPPEVGTRLHTQRNRYDEANWELIDQLSVWAVEHDISLLELAIGGLLAQPGVASVIAGATRPEQIAANVRAAQWQPTDEELKSLAELGTARQSYTTYSPRQQR